MAENPNKNRNKKIAAAGAALAAATAAIPFLTHNGEDTEVSRPAAHHEAAPRDAGVQKLRDGFGRVIKFVVQEKVNANDNQDLGSLPPDIESMNSRQLLSEARNGNLEAAKKVFREIGSHRNTAGLDEWGVSTQEFTLFERSSETADALSRLGREENDDRVNGMGEDAIDKAYESLLNALDAYTRDCMATDGTGYDQDPYDPEFLKLIGLTESQLKDKVQLALAYAERYLGKDDWWSNSAKLADLKKRYSIE